MSSTTNASALYTSPATQQRPYVQAPPRVGSAMRHDSKSQGHAGTESKGDDFCLRCCAALCYCCLALLESSLEDAV